jgi:hypothetical protein
MIFWIINPWLISQTWGLFGLRLHANKTPKGGINPSLVATKATTAWCIRRFCPRRGQGCCCPKGTCSILLSSARRVCPQRKGGRKVRIVRHLDLQSTGKKIGGKAIRGLKLRYLRCFFKRKQGSEMRRKWKFVRVLNTRVDGCCGVRLRETISGHCLT